LGEAGKFTGRYQCNLPIYFKISADARQAITREKQIKNWARAKKEFLINTLNPGWKPIDLQTWSG
jgi:putative endonuclease